MPSHYRFVMRSNTATPDMDYAQLRDAFGRTATLIEKARALGTNRLDSMDKGYLLKGVATSPKFCVRAIPIVALALPFTQKFSS